MLPLPIIFSLALTAAGPETRVRTADVASSPETEEANALEQIRALIDRVAGSIADASDVETFKAALDLARARPELQSEVLTLTNLGAELMRVLESENIEVEVQSTVESYIDTFGEPQRWRVRQILDMFLEFANFTAEARQSALADETFDLGQAVAAASELRPELTRLLMDSTLLNIVATAAVQRDAPLDPAISEELLRRWYTTTHELLLELDPNQKALDVVLQEQKGRGRLQLVRRTTYQQVEGANDSLATYVYYIVERSMNDTELVKLTMDHQMVWRFHDALQTIDSDTDFVALKVRFDDEPGPVEDQFDA